MAYFHYLDDIILLAVDPALLTVLTQALCNFLEAKGLVISPKSCTEPNQAVCWIGQKFDLKHMSVERGKSRQGDRGTSLQKSYWNALTVG